MVTRRLTSWFEPFGYQILEKDQRPDIATWNNPTEVYDLKDVFTTVDGSFDPGTKEGSIPDWARSDYMDYWAMQGKYYYPSVGGATHLFALVLKADGTPQPGKQHWYWTGGCDKLVAPYGGLQNWAKRDGESPSGFSNIPVGGHESGYAPPSKGPWFMCPFGLSDVLGFVGRYMGYHISTFAIWQARPNTLPPHPPIEPPPPNDTILAELQALRAEMVSLHADLRALAAHLGKTL